MKVFHSETHQKHRIPMPRLASGDSDAYLESPERVATILAALKKTPWAEITPPQDLGLEAILAVHTPAYLDYLQNAFSLWKDHVNEDGQVSIPYRAGIDVVTARSGSIPDQDGFFMTDLNVPICAGTYEATISSAYCGLSAAREVASLSPTALGLCRPPGHHAGREICGGFCYLNNAAIAAQWLVRFGKVAILDIDYHAGNGTQSIFYDRPEVFTVSLHADPARAYPNFAGYAQETGSGPGSGFHRNFPLPSGTDDDLYCQVLDQALALVDGFSPKFLVLSAGLDTSIHDPLSDLKITRNGFFRIGQMIADLKIRTAILLEGGYNTDQLGNNLVALLDPFTL